jgi:adenylate cyclase class 2
MNSPHNKSLQEIEVKFLIQDMPAFKNRLTELNVSLLSKRTHELNYRFDTADHHLTRQMQVLRLRQDQSATLTFKSAADPASEVSSRQEIEFEVGDFDTARRFLQALGYEVSIIYEKYRTTYQMTDCLLMLDELPYGIFLEIEGKDTAAIKKAAEMLRLNWDTRIKLSYLAIFYKLKEKLGLKASNLVFSEVTQTQFSIEDLLSVVTNGR